MTFKELEWWIWKMIIVEEYSFSELLLKMWRSNNNNKCWGGLGICLAFLCCWLLGFVWTTSWRGFSAWAREMKRLMWWKHGFICINKGDQEQSKHGRKIEGKKDQLYTMRNLNNDYLITKRGNSEMSNNRSLYLFVGLVV